MYFSMPVAFEMWCHQMLPTVRSIVFAFLFLFDLLGTKESKCIHYLYCFLLEQVVQETIDPNAKIEYRANREDYPQKGKPDITKAKELHGWEPKVEFRKGLPLMISDFGNASLVTTRN